MGGGEVLISSKANYQSAYHTYFKDEEVTPTVTDNEYLTVQNIIAYREEEMDSVSVVKDYLTAQDKAGIQLSQILRQVIVNVFL